MGAATVKDHWTRVNETVERAYWEQRRKRMTPDVFCFTLASDIATNHRWPVVMAALGGEWRMPVETPTIGDAPCLRIQHPFAAILNMVCTREMPRNLQWEIVEVNGPPFAHVVVTGEDCERHLH